jgi:hypothetical protein
VLGRVSCALEVELGEQHYQRLAEVSAIQLGPPHEDVASALSHGMDGDRRLLPPRTWQSSSPYLAAALPAHLENLCPWPVSPNQPRVR